MPQSKELLSADRIAELANLRRAQLEPPSAAAAAVGVPEDAGDDDAYFGAEGAEAEGGSDSD